MNQGVNFILGTMKQDLISCIKAIVERKPFIKLVANIPRPSNVGGALRNDYINILVWDLAMEPYRPQLVDELKKSYNLHIIYTATETVEFANFTDVGEDRFLVRPPLFTPTTSTRYGLYIEHFIDHFAKKLKVRHMPRACNEKIVVLASSTGGPAALEVLLKKLPRNCPPMVIVQHMSAGITKSFASRLNSLFPQEILEAETGLVVKRGRVLVAPAEQHIKLVQNCGNIAVECFTGPRIHGVMPAADYLFESAAEITPASAVGVVLTGMGYDGAKGLMQMKTTGCKNIGQNEATSVVYGMARAAKIIGALDYELPLDDIANKIIELT